MFESVEVRHRKVGAGERLLGRGHMDGRKKGLELKSRKYEWETESNTD